MGDSDIRRWARVYAGRGYALARIKPGEKKPTDPGWTEYGFPAERFREGDNIGIQAGGLSHDIVCVDLDLLEAVGEADRFLPPTGMVDGRPGKPRSHRWFLVKDVPPELTALPEVAGGVGGPRTRQFYREGPDKREMVVEFRGTGSQAVVPPSTWTDRTGLRREVRTWHSFGDPAEVDCRVLFEAVRRLAGAFGWVEREPHKARSGRGGPTEPPALLPLPAREAARQARTYVAAIPPAVEGEGGDNLTFRVARLLAIDFALPPEQAWPLLLEYNARCEPPWCEADLRRKLDAAFEQEGILGEKLRRRCRAIDVRVLPEGPVYVGLDVAGRFDSYVDLSPSLWAGVVKLGEFRALAPELASVGWEGRRVVLCPASTVATNRREVWSEYYLAKLLRRRGADVLSLHLAPLNGRRATVGAGGEGGLVTPPWRAGQAFLLAEEAGGRAREQDPHRKALPRRKDSPTLRKAIDFVRKNNVTSLDKQTLKRGKKNRLSRATLRRALSSLITHMHTSPHTLIRISLYLDPKESNGTRNDRPRCVEKCGGDRESRSTSPS
jgi:hypothetical protein